MHTMYNSQISTYNQIIIFPTRIEELVFVYTRKKIEGNTEWQEKKIKFFAVYLELYNTNQRFFHWATFTAKILSVLKNLTDNNFALILL